MAPLVGGRFCFIHDPALADKRAVTRRTGRRRAVPNASAALDVSSVMELQKVLGQVVGDTLNHPNSLQRSAVLARLVMTAAKLLADFETRILLEQLRDDMTQLRQQQKVQPYE